jgi:hypothetical protein
MNAAAIIAWLQQPSTIKAILLIAGLVGYHWDPSKIQEIITTVVGLYAAVGALYDQQPRRPDEPPPSPAETPLTEEGLKRLLAEAKAKKQV